MNKILIITNIPKEAKIMQEYLTIVNIQLVVKSDGEKGIESAMVNSYDLILLDVHQPDKDSYSICQTLRERLDIPILIMVEKDDEINSIKALNAGADENIVKSFSPYQLAVKIQGHLMRYKRIKQSNTYSKEQKEDLVYGRLRINHNDRRVFVDEQEIEMKHMEYELLFFLATHPNTVFDRESLYQQIWGIDSMGDNTTVYVHIYHIRKKIEENPGKPHYIQTIRSSGYRFQP